MSELLTAFILIDAVLEALRGQREALAKQPAPSPNMHPMDLDSTAPNDVPLERENPILEALEEMREQRMSMIANRSQYEFCYDAVLHGIVRDLEVEMRL